MRLEQSKDPDCTILWSSYHDNKFCDEQYKAELIKLEREDEYYYNVYTLGLWTPLNVVGQIYKKYVDKLEPDGNLAEFEYKKELPLILCCDFNVDPMKWALIQNLYGNDYVIDEIVQEDTYTDKMAEEVLSKYGNRKYNVYGDYTGTYRSTRSNKNEYEIMKRYLPNMETFLKPPPPITDRIYATHWRICNKEGKRRLFVNPKCTHTRKDFRSTVYKKGTHEEEQTVINNKKELSHLQAAIGYYCEYNYSLRGKPTVEWGDITYTRR